MDYLSQVFSFSSLWTITPALHIFSVIDEQDRTWNIETYVDSAISYSIEEGYDHVDGATRRYVVTLYAPYPKFYSWELAYSIDWQEWNFW